MSSWNGHRPVPRLIFSLQPIARTCHGKFAGLGRAISCQQRSAVACLRSNHRDGICLCLTSACSRQSHLSHLVLTHKLRQPRLQLKPTLGLQWHRMHRQEILMVPKFCFGLGPVLSRLARSTSQTVLWPRGFLVSQYVSMKLGLCICLAAIRTGKWSGTLTMNQSKMQRAMSRPNMVIRKYVGVGTVNPNKRLQPTIAFVTPCAGAQAAPNRRSAGRACS